MNFKTLRKKRDNIWYENPTILFKNNRWALFFPNETMTTAEVLNTFMRFSIYLFIILSVINDETTTIIIPIFMGVLTWFLYSYSEYNKRNKKFFDEDDYSHYNQYGDTLPTKQNPFMNTLLTDLSTGTKREPAADPDDPEVKKMIEYNFNKDLYKDADDLYNKNNSQNRFVTMPNTNEYGIASGDTVKFANWLYNTPAPTCKEDTTYCTNNYSAFNTFDNRL